MPIALLVHALWLTSTMGGMKAQGGAVLTTEQVRSLGSDAFETMVSEARE